MWGLDGSNLICSEKEMFHVHKIHLEKLLHMKPDLIIKSREIPYFMKNKLYLKEINRERAIKQNHENLIMARKLYFHSVSPSPYSKNKNIPSYCPAFDKQRYNFDKIERQKNINNQNIFLYKRFFAKKSYYPTKQLLQKNDYENYIRNNISRFQKHQPFNGQSLCTYRQFLEKLVKEAKKFNRLSSARNNSVNMNAFKYSTGIKSQTLFKTKIRYNKNLDGNKRYVIRSADFDGYKKYNIVKPNIKMKRSQSAFILEKYNKYK